MKIVNGDQTLNVTFKKKKECQSESSEETRDMIFFKYYGLQRNMNAYCTIQYMQKGASNYISLKATQAWTCAIYDPSNFWKDLSMES